MTQIRDDLDGLARAWELRRGYIKARDAASLIRTVLATPDQPVHVGHLLCPTCGEEVPLGTNLVVDEFGELSAEVDVSDIWSHAWTHS